MKPYLIKRDDLEKEQYNDIMSSFGIADEANNPMCCCASCIKWTRQGMLRKTSMLDRRYLPFIELLFKYYDRFGQEPTFELAQSLFDDCFKNTVTRSE